MAGNNDASAPTIKQYNNSNNSFPLIACIPVKLIADICGKTNQIIREIIIPANQPPKDKIVPCESSKNITLMRDAPSALNNATS